jgi:hypothetical protein
VLVIAIVIVILLVVFAGRPVARHGAPGPVGTLTAGPAVIWTAP